MSGTGWEAGQKGGPPDAPRTPGPRGGGAAAPRDPRPRADQRAEEARRGPAVIPPDSRCEPCRSGDTEQRCAAPAPIAPGRSVLLAGTAGKGLCIPVGSSRGSCILSQRPRDLHTHPGRWWQKVWTEDVRGPGRWEPGHPTLPPAGRLPPRRILRVSESFGSRGKGTIVKFRETHTAFLPGPIITKSAKASADPGAPGARRGRVTRTPAAGAGGLMEDGRTHPAPARGGGEPAPDRAVTAASGAQTHPPGTPARAVKDSGESGWWTVWNAHSRHQPPNDAGRAPYASVSPNENGGQDHVNAKSFPILKFQSDSAWREGSAFRRVS